MAGTLPPITAVLLADTTQFMAKMGEAGVEMELISKKGSGAFAQLAAIGKGALFGLGAAAVGIGVISTKLAMDFQASMERIATQAQVPQSQIAGLSDQVLTLAGKVGFAPNSLAQALYHIESTFQSTGITGAKAMDLLKVAAEGAKIGGSNLVDTTNALDAAIVAGIPGANDFKQVMGALNATVGAGDMTMQDLAGAIGTGVIPVVKDYGLTLNDVGAALATFGDNNIRGADAGTKLRMAVQAMAVPIRGGEKALKDMGMTANQMAGDMAKGGLLPALEDLRKHMEAIGLTGIAMDKNGVFTSVGEKIGQIFGKRAGTGVAILYDQLARLESKFPDIAHAAGSFDDAWKETVKTGKVQWDMLKAAAEALSIRIGEWLIPKLISLKNWLSDVYGWFEKHRTVALMLAAAIAGPLVVAIGAYIVEMIATAAVTLAALWPVMAVVAAVAALAAGVYYAYTHWKWFRETVQAVWDWIKGTLWPGMQAFAAWVGGAFNDAVKWAGAEWKKLAPVVEQAWHDISTTVTKAWDDTLAFLRPKGAEMRAWWDAHWSEIRTVAVDTWKAIQDQIGFAIQAVGLVIAAGMLYVKDVWIPTWNVIKTVIPPIWAAIQAVVSVAMHYIETIIGVGLDIIAGHWSHALSDMKAGVVRMFNDVASFMGQMIGALGGLAAQIGAAIVHGIVSAIGGGGGLVNNAIAGLLSGLPGGGALAGLLHLGGGGSGGGGAAPQGSAPFVPSGGGSRYRPTAHAAGGVASGWSWVGEKGPELAFFGQPAQIIPNHQIHALASGGGGTTINHYYVTVPVQGSVVSEGDLLRNIHAGLLRMKRGTVTLGLA